jgi:hypothetical protein
MQRSTYEQRGIAFHNRLIVGTRPINLAQEGDGSVKQDMVSG